MQVIWCIQERILAHLRAALDRPIPRRLAERIGFRKIVMEVQATYIPADLIFVDGKQSGRRVQLNSPRFIIGREVDCNLQLEDGQISRHHAVFLGDAYGIRIRDLGSLNGTWVNGERIASQVTLRHGDRVQIGESTLLLHAPALATVAESPTRAGLADTQAAPIRQPGPRHY